MTQDTRGKVELLPCPFCGGEAFMKKAQHYLEFPMCRKCGCHVGTIDHWQARTPNAEAVTPDIEKLCACIVEYSKAYNLHGLMEAGKNHADTIAQARAFREGTK